VATVTLHTDSVGNEMHPGAQVMVKGVQVGEVRQISANGTGARLVLAIQPGMVPLLPANVTAEMLPTTLFGERYVDLLIPAHPSARRLAAGSIIRQDRSADAVELENVLNNLLPLLQASEPDKLAITLTALAQGLQGRGTELGQTLVQLSSILHRYNPHLPALDTDIKELAGVARTLNQASPDLLQALDYFTVTSATLVSERASFAALYATVTTASNDLRAFLDANSSNIIQLSTDSTPTLQILARYSPEFPCVLKNLANFVPAANKLLGKGTNQPGLHVQAIVVPVYVNARYLPGVDTPKYGDNRGPRCYPVPFKGITLNDGATPLASVPPVSTGSSSTATGVSTRSAYQRPQRPPKAGAATTVTTTARTATTTAQAASTTALAGSPLEGELVRELTALALAKAPASVPPWTTLLLAPLFRGADVSLVARS
jgi:phospholipid/cholesterol/gamma-HCH transport system substrate-binding protein